MRVQVRFRDFTPEIVENVESVGVSDEGLLFLWDENDAELLVAAKDVWLMVRRVDDEAPELAQ